MTKKTERPADMGEPVTDEEAANEPTAEVEYEDVVTERDLEDEPGEFPVYGHESLYVPKGVTLTDILERLTALESAVFGKGKK